MAVDSVGSAGGIILLWDPRKVQIKDNWSATVSLSAITRDVENGQQWMISSVYGPS